MRLRPHTDYGISSSGWYNMHILIADPKAIVRTGLACFVEQLGVQTTIFQATSWEEAVAAATEQRPDLAILDLFRANGNAGAQIAEFCAKAEPAAVIVFNEGQSADLVRDCIKAGAKAFVPKATEERQLIDIIRLVLDGGTYIPAEMLSSEPIGARNSRRHRGQSTEAGLTGRQVDVLNCLRLGMSNHEIASKLGLNLSTVKGHVSAVLKGLGVRNRTQAVIASRNIGL